MGATVGNVLAGTIEGIVRVVVIPVTSVIPVLVRTGILLAVFVGLWVAFGVGLVVDRDAVARVWQSLASAPLPVQAIAWLLFLPLTAGLWVWGTDWPEVLRFVVIGGLAVWNVLVFLPRPERSTEASTAS